MSDILQRYQFDWDVLNILGGKSAIDSMNPLNIKSPEDARKFLDCYGYDLDDPIEKAELFGNFQESISFIRRYFLQPENPEGVQLEIPRKVSEVSDITQLLVLAGQGSSVTSMWACAILKVMHTVAHVDKDIRSHYFSDIQTQILDRFYKFIHSDEKQVYLGANARDLDRVDLVLFESKPKKSRDSVILKLLHKQENVAEDIFDRIGIRFVTSNRFDAIRIVKFLKERYIVMPFNIKPSRSRNSLVEPAVFNEQLQTLFKQVNEGKLAAGDLHQRLVDVCQNGMGNGGSSENPHTSESYRSIQFTCRQLIKLKNPLYDDLKSLKNEVRGKTVPEEVRRITDKLDLRNIQKQIRFFYPFEVQIYDDHSHQENMAGRSSHTNYKKNQVHAAMRRVLGPLLKVVHDEPRA